MFEQSGVEIKRIRSLVQLKDNEISDCVNNAILVLKKLKQLGIEGKIIFVDAHAYIIPEGFSPDELAINPKTITEFGDGETEEFVEFEDHTIGELIEMVKNGKAEDITSASRQTFQPNNIDKLQKNLEMFNK